MVFFTLLLLSQKTKLKLRETIFSNQQYQTGYTEGEKAGKRLDWEQYRWPVVAIKV